VRMPPKSSNHPQLAAGFDRNQGEYSGLWITLDCQPSFRPSWFFATAGALGRYVPHFTFDSRSGLIRGPSVQ